MCWRHLHSLSSPPSATQLQNCKIAKLQFYLHLKSIFALLPPRRANSTQFSFGRQIGPVWSNQVVTFLPRKLYNKRKELIYKLSITADVNSNLHRTKLLLEVLCHMRTKYCNFSSSVSSVSSLFYRFF